MLLTGFHCMLISCCPTETNFSGKNIVSYSLNQVKNEMETQQKGPINIKISFF